MLRVRMPRRRDPRPRAAHLQPGGPRRRRRARRPADAAAAAARRGRPADRLRPPARHAAPGRDRQDPRAARPSRPRSRPASSSSTTSTTTGELVPVDRPPATNTASIVVGLIRNRTERYPEGMLRVALLGDPTRALGSLAEPECRARDRRARPRRAARRAVRVVRALLGREDRDGLRHGEHGLGRGRAEADRRVHPGRRRDQRDRDRHQRRRPAVLQRRGDDAHAHQGHPRDDAGERDGADRQAGARLLRRRVGRGQLRHRRLRARHGPERPGAVLGARPRRRLRGAARLLRARLRGAGRALPAPRAPAPTRVDRDVAARRTTRPTPTWRRSARSSPRRPTRAARSRSTSAR